MPKSDDHHEHAPTIPEGRLPANTRKPPSTFEDVVVLGFAIAGFAGGVILWNLGLAPIIVSLFFGTGVAALVYRFLGGIQAETSMTIGVVKVGGTLAALLGTTLLIFQQLPQTFILEGELVGIDELANPKMSSDDQNLYIRLVRHESSSYEYRWILVTPNRLSSQMEFFFHRDTGRSDSKTQHQIQIEPNDFSRRAMLHIRYKKQEDKLYLERTGSSNALELPAMATSLPARLPGTAGWPSLTSNLFAEPLPPAQVKVAPALLGARLDNDDLIIRQNARTQLIALGRDAVPTIRSILQGPKSSYRQMAGALAVFYKLNDVNAGDLKGAPFSNLLQALRRNPDTELSDEGNQFFSKYGVAGSNRLTSGQTGQPIDVRAMHANDVEFRFFISANVKPGQSIEIRVDKIQCFGSSPGSARWSFLVLADGIALDLPERIYENGKSYVPSTIGPLHVQALTRNSQIRIFGYRP